MNKGIVLGMVILVIGMSFTGTTNSLSVSKSQKFSFDGNILYVGGNGSGNYTTIQSAINDASDGDTVFVFDDSSPYKERLVVDKLINLIGEDKNTTVVQTTGYYLRTVIKITSNGVLLKDFTIKTTDGNYGYCVYLISDSNTIIDNRFIGGDTNLRLKLSSGNIISNNNFLDANDGIGFLFDSNNNVISNNTFNGVSFCIMVGIWDDFGDPIDTRNQLIEYNIINNAYGWGIKAFQSDNLTISHNIIRFTEATSLYIGGLDYFTISDNVIEYCSGGSGGIRIESCSHGIVTRNTLYLNSYFLDDDGAIELYDSTNNYIIRNNISETKGIGISLIFSDHNEIFYNNLINNDKNAYDNGNNKWDSGYPSVGGNYWDDYTGEDNDGDGIGDTPYPISGGGNKDRYPLMEPCSDLNLPPIKPFIIGYKIGKVGIPYTFTFTSVDPDDDDVSYYIDWSDGDITDWTDFQSSGNSYIESHTWTRNGIYTIKGKSKDNHGFESVWGTFDIVILRNKATNYVSFWRLCERFPLLQRLLDIWMGDIE